MASHFLFLLLAATALTTSASHEQAAADPATLEEPVDGVLDYAGDISNRMTIALSWT
jgi:hypothetical protein